VWGISTWVPPFVWGIAGKAGPTAQQWASYAALAFNFGALIGQAGFGFLADRFGRKPITLAYFAIAFVMTPALFLWTKDPAMLLLVAAVNAFFCQGLFSWMPTWLPELFPTHLRAAAMAFTFNMPRFIAFLGPLVAGALIVKFGGYGYGAMMISCFTFLASQPRFSSRRREARRSQKGSSVLSDQVYGARCRFDHIRSASTAWPRLGAQSVLPATDKPQVS
jgi:MFS family permease